MAYTIGGISGCHINPAITLGCYLSGRMNSKDCGMYMIFQVIGAIIAAAVLYLIVSTSPGLAEGTTTGANACAASQTNGATNNFAGLAIGLSLILIHLVGIHYTGTSVNPARSIGPALFEGGQALTDLWVFIVGPFIGAACAAGIWKMIEPEK